MKDKVLEYLSELQEQVQSLRENGETDLRTVLRFIDSAKSKVSKLDDKLDEAVSLLSDAVSLLNSIHGYDTETYRDICKFLRGGEEEGECCENCDEPVDDCQCEFCDQCNENINYNCCTCNICDCGSNLDADEECECNE